MSIKYNLDSLFCQSDYFVFVINNKLNGNELLPTLLPISHTNDESLPLLPTSIPFLAIMPIIISELCKNLELNKGGGVCPQKIKKCIKNYGKN